MHTKSPSQMISGLSFHKSNDAGFSEQPHSLNRIHQTTSQSVLDYQNLATAHRPPGFV